MKAMILAAGFGRRLLPLTEHLPKPLIEIHGKPVIVRLIEQLAAQGFTELVINVSYLAEKIQAALGDGHQFNVHIEYSVEDEALETGGGITKALPLLGDEPFLVVNSDIVTDYPFAELRVPHESLAHLVLIDKVVDSNSEKQGDFSLINDHVSLTGDKFYTYSGIAVYHPKLFKDCVVERFLIVPLLKAAMQNKSVTGEIHYGQWEDIGNLQRLQKLQQEPI